MDVEARESLPATVPDETVLKTIEVRSHLYPAQDGIFEKKRSLANGALALHDSSVNGQRHLRLCPGLPSLAESAAVEADAKAKAEVAKARIADAEAVEAEAKARVAESAAVEADAKAKSEVAKARAADANARAVEAEAEAKARVAKAQSLKADISIFKLRRELDVVGEFGVKKYLSVRLSHCLFF